MKIYHRTSTLKSTIIWPQFHSGSQILAPAKNRGFLRFIHNNNNNNFHHQLLQKGFLRVS